MTAYPDTQGMLARLRERAERRPDSLMFTHLGFDAKPPLEVGNGALWQASCSVAAALAAQSTHQRPVLLVYAAGPDFAPAFFGTLLAGAIAVPVPVPQFPAQYERLERIAADCSPGAILTTVDLQQKLLAKLAPDSALRSCAWIATDDLPTTAFDLPESDPQALALLQYTSGSTSEPKGVALTHANLAHNLDLLKLAFSPRDGVRIVSWLPHFHDMGLVTGIMAPLRSGGDAVLMSPLAFLQRPLRWLQAISDYGGGISGAPNFAYEQCMKAAQRGERPQLDLGSWRHAFAGAEPVRMRTLEAFADCFARDGFQREAFTPCYGMAEATLIVTCKTPETAPTVHKLARGALQAGRAEPANDADVVQLTGCGKPVGATQLRIVDPERRVEVPQGHVGEAWIAGPQVARGYWTPPADDPFGAQLADGSEKRYLRTGDLGFIAADGEFVFVDRLKDLVIVNGQNYACHDLELSAGNGHELVSAENCVAVSSDGAHGTHLLIVAELPAQAVAEAEAVAAAMRASLFRSCGLAVQTIAFVAPRRLCRTTSGKLQRRLTAQRLYDGSLAALAQFGEPLPPHFSSTSRDKPTP
ncbi:MAG: fatty acyl-AMP ligase [Gammaproteobacteria bacterium]